MSSTEQAFAACLVKEAASEPRKKSYLRQMGALAPAAVIQAAADFPRGYIDKGIENKIVSGTFKGKHKKGTIPPWKTGLGRGGGRLGAALVTTPMFLGGIKQLANAKNRRDKQIGAVKIVGAGAIYSGLKGALEGTIVHGSPLKKDPITGKLTEGAKASWSKIKGIAGVRGVLGTAAAAATAVAIAKNLKKKDKKSFYERAIKPSMIGAGIGGVKGGLEKLWLNRKNLRGLTPKGVIGAIGGRAAAGAIGAFVLSEIADKFIEKTSSSAILDRFSGITKHTSIIPPGELYTRTLMSSKKKGKREVEIAYDRMRRDDPERSPTSRAMYYALYDDLSSRGVRIPRPLLRDKVNPPVSSNNAGSALGILGASLSPYIAEQAMDSIPKGKADMVLQDALDNIIAKKGYTREVAGEGASASINIAERIVRTQPQPGASTLAHEVGHMTNSALRKDLLQSATATKYYKGGRVMAYILPVAAVALSGDTSFTTREELKAKASFARAVGMIAGAAMAPRIVEESIANLKGLSALRRAAPSRGIKKSTATSTYLRRMLPKYLGYAAPLLAPALAAAYFDRKARRARR